MMAKELEAGIREERQQMRRVCPVSCIQCWETEVGDPGKWARILEAMDIELQGQD